MTRILIKSHVIQELVNQARQAYAESMDKNSVKILGVMTGTSCDGLDAGCIEIDLSGRTRMTPLWDQSVSFPPALRKEVIELQKSGSKHTLRSICLLDAKLGEWY